jgi:hypothetical protein
MVGNQKLRGRYRNLERRVFGLPGEQDVDFGQARLHAAVILGSLGQPLRRWGTAPVELPQPGSLGVQERGTAKFLQLRTEWTYLGQKEQTVFAKKQQLVPSL